MKNILILLISIIIFCSCNNKLDPNNFINKDFYEVKVGETINIYYSTNSCCYYCILNLSEISNVSFIKDTLIINSEEDCQGCNELRAFEFKATKLGLDTIKLNSSTASQDCYSKPSKPMTYIIKVK